MPTYTYLPRYKISTKPLTPGQRVLFKRGNHKGQTRTLIGLLGPGAFVTTNIDKSDYIHHVCNLGYPITDIIVPLRPAWKN